MGHGAARARGYGITHVKNKKKGAHYSSLGESVTLLHLEMNKEDNNKSNTHMVMEQKLVTVALKRK